MVLGSCFPSRLLSRAFSAFRMSAFSVSLATEVSNPCVVDWSKRGDRSRGVGGMSVCGDNGAVKSVDRGLWGPSGSREGCFIG